MRLEMMSIARAKITIAILAPSTKRAGDLSLDTGSGSSPDLSTITLALRTFRRTAPMMMRMTMRGTTQMIE